MKTNHASSLALAVLAAILFASPALAQGVSGAPDFYGRVEVVGTLRPAVVNRKPILVERAWAAGEPIYLRVRPGHAEQWTRHCLEYFACDDPVYFVRDDWYSDVYAPQVKTLKTAGSQ